MLRSTLLAAATAAALSLSATSAASAEIVADNGFRPDPNGFSFPNYGKAKGVLNLTPADVQRAFGNRVCASLADGVCDLTTPAEAWMNEMNASMAGGHCFGFSTLALLRYAGHEMGLGDGPTFALTLPGNPLLQRELAYAWAFQDLPGVTERVLTGTPNQLLAQLVKRLTPDAKQRWTVAIINPKIGGHGITPYAVDDLGGGRYDVLVYDNNWPGETGRMHFDTKRNTYRYNAMLNPQAGKPMLFSGTAKTPSHLMLYPVTPGLGVQQCAFCQPGQGGAVSKRYNQISLEADRANHADIVAVDRQGRRTGVVDGREVNEIPGASIRYPLSVDPDLPERRSDPTLRIPAKVHVRVELDGRPLSSADRELVTLTGPGYSVTVDGIHLRPGERNRLVVAPKSDAVAYTTAEGQDESPSVGLGLVRDNGDDVDLQLQALTAPGGSTVRVARDDDRRRVRFSSTATRTEAYLVKLTETRQSSTHVFAAGVKLHHGERATLDYAGLTPRTKLLDLRVSGLDGTRTVRVPRLTSKQQDG